MSVTRSLQVMVRAALCQEPWGALDALVGQVATAAGSELAVLWVPAYRETAAPDIIRLAAWQGREARFALPARPEPSTLRAFAERSVVMPDPEDGAEPVAGTGEPQAAAFSVPLAADFQAVLTLYGQDGCADDAFDVTVDLLDVLPELCLSVRDRQARSLAQRCHQLFLDADQGAPVPVSEDRLRSLLTSVCDAVATALGCSDVSLRLHHVGGAFGAVPVALAGASSSHDPDAAAPLPGPDSASGDALNVVGGADVLSAPVLAGEDLLGVMGCRRTEGRCFTQWDVAIVHAVAEQVARDWTVRARHWSVFAEIDSWRALARSITELNERLSDELERKSHRDDRVYEAAQRVLRSVVPGLVGGHVWRVEDGGASRGVVPEHAYPDDTGDHSGDDSGRGGAGPPSGRPSGRLAGRLAADAYAARRQKLVVERRSISREGYGRNVGWVISTPIGVGEEIFGVLDAVGTGTDVAAISPQVCRIVGDHLGLYQHLRSSLDTLRETRGDLEATIRTQAETLEDLEHQLVSPLINATNRIEGILRAGRLESRSTAQLRAVRGLCRKASRVAMSAGVFASLSQGRTPVPKLDFFSAEDLVRLLVNAADDAQQLSDPRRGIRFTVERDSVLALGRRLVRVDRSFLDQCVGNLLDNAAKYGYQDTCVLIRGVGQDDRFAISVASTGIRLRHDEARRCLERNWRGAQAKSATGEGSGLGLWIAAQLMASMRGSVRVVPEGDATTVTLAVPLC